MRVESFQPLIEALGWTLVHFSWQAVAIAVVLWYVLSLTRRVSPQFRYAISGLALVAMFASAVVTFAGEYRKVAPQAATAVMMPSTATAIAPAAGVLPEQLQVSIIPVSVSPAGVLPIESASPPVWPLYLVGAWLLGVVVFSLRLLRSWWTVRQLKRAGSVPVDASLGQRFSRLCEKMRLSRPVRLLVSESARVPMVIGWIKPVVLVPTGVLAGLSSAQLEAVLAHELAHVCRHDYLVNLLQLVVETLFFFHPAVWWVGAQLRREREHCCDDVATRVCGDALGYAGALAALEGMRVGVAPVLGVAANDGSLLARIRRVVGCEEPPRSVWPVVFLVPLVVAIGWLAIFSASPAQAVGEGDKEDESEVQTAVRAGLWELAGGVRLEIDQNVYHGSDVMTQATLHWPANNEEAARRYRIGVAADAFAARDPWAVAWETDKQVLWIAGGALGGKPQAGKALPDLQSVSRIDYSNLEAIKNVTANKSGPPEFAPASILEALGSSFEVPAQVAGGVFPSDDRKAERALPSVTVRVIDGDTEKPVPSAVLSFTVGEKVHRVTVDEMGEISLPSEVVDNGRLAPTTHGYLPNDFWSWGAPKVVELTDEITTIRIYSAEGVVGKVLDEDGVPVTGARVSVRARIMNLDTMKKLGLRAELATWDHGEYPNWSTIATSDGNGEFRYTKPLGKDLSWVDVSCAVDGFARMDSRDGIEVVDLDRKFEVGPNDIVLSKGVQVQLKVVDSEGKPLSGLSAYTVGERGRHVRTDFGFSDADGKFPVARMVPGNYQVSAPSKPILHGNQTGSGITQARPLSELPLPFTAQELKVEAGEEMVELTLRALPHRLVKIDWDERRPAAERRMAFDIEADFRGTLWKTDIRFCAIDANTTAMCALVPAEFQKMFLRLNKYDGVYHFVPAAGGETRLGIFPIALRDDGESVGTIVAEKPAMLLLRIEHNGHPWKVKKEQVSAKAIGRFGTRELPGRVTSEANTWSFSNIYPDEDVEFSVEDPRFKPTAGKEEKLALGEKRMRVVDLPGR